MGVSRTSMHSHADRSNAGILKSYQIYMSGIVQVGGGGTLATGVTKQGPESHTPLI